MKFFNQIVVLLKKLGIPIDPVLLMVLVLLIPLLIGGIVAFIAWRNKRRAEQALRGGGPGSVPPEQAQTITPKALLSVWDRFLTGLPGEFRRAIRDFQPFVVLGPSLTGKTALIQAYTDCQRQQNQFLGSAVEDPNLQIYLGSSVLVHEVSSTLLKDTSTAARKALTKLWTRCFQDTPVPVVVVPIRLTELTRTPVDVLQSQAEVIRGKINLLSWVLNKRIEVRVALTHLDDLEGYPDFVEFAQKSGLPLSLPIDGEGPRYVFDKQIEEKFAGFERYLALALTRLPAAQYRGLLKFLEASPEHLPVLSRFLDALYSVDPLTKPPVAGPIYLTSASHRGTHTTTPFAARLLDGGQRRKNPLLWHEVATVLLVALPVGYFATGYYLERSLWLGAEKTLSTYTPASMSEVDEQRARAQIAHFTQRDLGGRFISWFPAFFGSAQGRVEGLLIQKIRNDRIIPGLKKASGEEWAHLRTLYFLGLLQATRENELGTTALSNLRRWSSATGLPDGMIRDYIHASREGYEGEVNNEDLPDEVTINARDKDERWVLFLRTLQRGMERGVFESLDFKDLQDEAGQILADVRRTQGLVDRFAEAPRILAMLVRANGFRHKDRYERFFREFAPTPEYRARLSQQEAVLSRVAGAALPLPPDAPDTLERFCRKLKLALDEPPDNGAVIVFSVLGEELTFDPLAWSRVVRASSLRRHILTFIGQNAQNPYSIFFPVGTKLEPVLMNPRSDGNATFIGKASLDGMHTARAFDKYVRPPLHDLTLLRERFGPESEEERDQLDDFVYQEVERYARAYVTDLMKYYRAYNVSTDFPDAVLVLIRQMVSERSPFTDFLTVITENSQLPLEGSRYDRPFHEAFEPFDSWKKLTATDDNARSTELGKYKAILLQLQSALEARTDPAGPAPAEAKSAEPPPEPTDLEMSVSPTGRVALTLLDKNAPRSFRGLVVRWLNDVSIPDELREPFLAPLREIERIGREDIQNVVAQVWQTRMLLSVGGVLRRFPFDQTSDVDATPQDLELVFHPVKGQFFELYRQFVKPISREKGEQITAVAGLKVPGDMYPFISAARRLADQLWLPTGEPKPYRLQVSPVPFENGQDIESVLTLVYLSTGSTSMFNFNQKAYEKTLEIDWTKPQTSQIGIQLTNVNTRRSSYPNPVVAQDSYWSFLRLIARAEAKPPYWSWTFRGGDEGVAGTVARFMVRGDPWAPFRLKPEQDKVPTKVASATEAQP